MEQKIYFTNTLSGKKELFEPLKPPYVGMYSCGPTVYDEVHLGNVRTFMAFDVVYRYLVHVGYKVRYVRNITDAGHLTNDAGEGVDRIEESAKLEQLEPMEVVQKYTDSFHEVCRIFNILPPSIEPTATGHIIEQIEMVKRILENGYAYESKGSVYFDVKKYMEKYNYGELSGRNIEELMEGSRELEGQEEKKNSVDFAIWKAVASNHIQRWPSPWGEGIPGWHLECSAMGTKYLGKQFDIHGGGMDLKFPHHECEIAQSVGADGIKPVRYWLHANMLTVNGDKMSKSKGNSFLPRELISGDHPLLEKGYSPMAIRFFMLQAHYRSTLDFSNEALKAAEKGFSRLMNATDLLHEIKPGSSSSSDIKKLQIDCYAAMNDDINTSILLSHLFEGVRIINSVHAGTETISADDLELLKKIFNDFLVDVLGIKSDYSVNNDVVDKLMHVIISLRKEVRSRKDFATSDKIRDELEKVNIKLKDEKDGTNWVYES
jgi:cysteinyl-tRNA synthetase